MLRERKQRNLPQSNWFAWDESIDSRLYYPADNHLERMRLRYRRLLPLLLLLLGGSLPLLAQPVGPSQPVDFGADSLVVRQVGGEEINELWGNVRINQGEVRITSNRAVYNSRTQHAVLTGNVVVTQPGTRLYAQRAEYNGGSKTAVAPNGVTIREDDGATLTASYGEYDMGARKASFRNGVRLVDNNATLRAASGDYYSFERRAIFRGGVRVESDSGNIVARELTYWRDSQETFAVGSVVLTPKARAARLTGDTLRHQPANGYTVARGAPRLVDIDTVRNADGLRRDTTVITSRLMESFRSGGSEEYRATGDVRLRRSELQARAALSRYLPGSSVIALGSGKVRVAPPPDTVSAVDTAAVTGGPTPPPSAGDRDPALPIVWYNEAQLTGDTITVGLFEKKLRSIDAFGNGFAVSEGKFPKRYDQFAGVRLVLDVLMDTVRQVRSEGEASSIYFAYREERGDGVNRSSGDTIRVGFREGKASRVSIRGGAARAEGEYFPEPMVVGQEENYRLRGFGWYKRDPRTENLEGSLPKAPVIPAPQGDAEKEEVRSR